MNRKIVTARINLLLVLFFLIPALIFFSRAVSDYRILSETNFVESVVIRNNEFLEIDPETKHSLDDLNRKTRESRERQEKTNRSIYMFTFMINILVALGMFSFSILMLISKAELKGNKLRYRYLFKTGEISVESITEILINRTTPLYKDNLTIENISWREKVIINQGMLVFSGFLYPKLNLIVSEILEINPNIKIDYYINTFMDNVQNR